MNLKVILIFLLVVILCGFVFVKSRELFVKKDLASPVLGISTSDISVNAWEPKYTPGMENNFPDAPEITATSAFFVNPASGQVLYAKNPNQKMKIASLTKIMSVIIALERKNLDDVYTVSDQASEMEPDKMYLLPGEKHTLKNLLDGIFLVSANDAAETLAEGTTGRREEFINLMNSKALQLGMNNTLFVNPSGLEEDGKNYYSTSIDVAIMSRYLIKKWPQIISISSQPYVYIEKTDWHQDYEMYSGINLLTTYPGVLGLKTGFTPEAGLTLVTYAVQGNKEVLGVLLNATNRRDDAKVLLDYSFSKMN